MKRLAVTDVSDLIDPGVMALARRSVLGIRNDAVKRLFGRIFEQYARLLSTLAGLDIRAATRRSLSLSLTSTVATAGSRAEQLDKLQAFLDQTSVSAMERELALVRAAITRTRDVIRIERLVGRETEVSATRNAYISTRDIAEELRDALVSLCARLDLMTEAAIAPTEVPDNEFRAWIDQLTQAAIPAETTTSTVQMAGAMAPNGVPPHVVTPSVLEPRPGSSSDSRGMIRPPTEVGDAEVVGGERGLRGEQERSSFSSRRWRTRAEKLLRLAVLLAAIGGPVLVALELRYHVLRRHVVIASSLSTCMCPAALRGLSS